MAGPRCTELPEIAPAGPLRERTLRRARQGYRDEVDLAGRPWARGASRLWLEWLAPGLLVGGAAVYLIWALRFCAALSATGG